MARPPLHWALAGLGAVVVLSAAVALANACGSRVPSATQAAAASDPATDPATDPGTGPGASGEPSPDGSTTATAQPTPARSTPASQPAPARFGTLPPGSALPSDAQCAAWVRAKPFPENKGVNKAANSRTGQHIGSSFFNGDDPRANSRIAPRVDGQFTGTTHQILRWAACKWGIDEDIVLAQAAIESWWRQNTLGDWTTDPTRCAPGRGLGVDGQRNECPESFGILQNRYLYERSGWPGFADSTAMNADLAYAIWRTCYEGYEGWLNTVERGRQYAAGDAWGCVGRWFSGRWHVSDSERYVSRVRDYLNQRIWETPNFQQP
jgi:autotransporter family porin